MAGEKDDNNTPSAVKFLKGSLAEYNAAEKAQTTFYLVDNKDLYLGNTKLSGSSEAADDKVNKSGDTMTGNLYISKSSEPLVGVTNGTRQIVLMIGSGGVNRGIHDSIDNAWIVYKDEANLNTPLPFKTAAGEVKYTDKSSIKYNSTDECIEFIFN